MENKENYERAAKVGGITYFIAVFTLIFFTLIFSLCVSAIEFDKSSLIYCVSGYAVSPVALITTIAFGKRFSGGSLKNLLSVNKFSPLYLIPAVILPFSMLSGFGAVNDLIAELGLKLNLNVSTPNLPLNGTFDYIILMIFICVIPAAIEEAVFRGMIQGFLKGCGAAGSFIAVGVCFAFYHLSLFSFAYQLIFGIVLAVLRWKSGSVIPCVISHFLNNFINLSLLYFNIPFDFYSPLYISLGIAVTASVTLFMIFYKKNERQNTSSIKNFWLPFGAFATAFAGLIAILTAVAI